MSSNQLTAQTPGSELIRRVSDRSLSVNARVRSVGDFLSANKATMLSALPKHITPDRLIRVTLNCIRKTPKLLDCKPDSLFGAIIEASALGLEPNGILGHGYLIPYGDECVLVPGYKGLIDLCRRSGNISTLTAECVHQGDQFAYQLGDDPFIRHIPNDADPKRHEKPVTYVYVVVKLRDGGIQRKVWSADKVNAHKEQYSQAWRRAEKGKKDSPWHTDWQVMAKKTVIRDIINRGEVPVSVEIQNLTMREEMYEAERARTFDAPVGMTLDELDGHLTGRTTAESSDSEGDGGDSLDPGELDTALIEEATAAFKTCETLSSVGKCEEEYRTKAANEGTRATISDLANETRERVRATQKAAKGEKQGQLAGTA